MDQDLLQNFLQKVSPNLGGKIHIITPPTLGVWERMIRRLSHRNERALYKRKCDLTGKEIISTYSPDKPFKVYETQAWWGDRWDGKDYGRDFDFDRPFFEQFAELQRDVPRMSLIQSQNENAAFTNCVSHLKDCYLLFSSDYDRDCYYGLWVQQCVNCADNIMIDYCELTYDSVFSKQLYNCIHVLYSNQCTDCAFLMDCRSCRNCFMCTGLRNKEHCIMNKQYSKEEYDAFMSDVDLGSYSHYQHYKQEFQELMKKADYPYMRYNGRVENSTGDFLMDVMNCENCYGVVEAKDVANTQSAWKIKDAVDCSYVNRELGYENCECFPMPTCSAFNVNSYDGNDLYYSDTCMNSAYLFGCIGLKRDKYCILNKQYSQEEYEDLVPRIIEHMKQHGEWGEFFPVWLSPYAYNETNAQDYDPLDKTEAEARGYRWKDEVGDAPVANEKVELPDNIKDVDEGMCKAVLTCEVSGRAYKVVQQEIDLYKRMGVSVPRRSFQARHDERWQLLGTRKLWDRACDECGASMQSSIDPAGPERVLCGDCYRKVMY